MDIAFVIRTDISYSVSYAVVTNNTTNTVPSYSTIMYHKQTTLFVAVKLN